MNRPSQWFFIVNDPTPMSCHFCGDVNLTPLNESTSWWRYTTVGDKGLNGVACSPCHDRIEAMTPEELGDLLISRQVAKVLESNQTLFTNFDLS